jgi:hypothetical protein
LEDALETQWLIVIHQPVVTRFNRECHKETPLPPETAAATTPGKRGTYGIFARCEVIRIPLTLRIYR